jgi:hypothetical protein
MSLESYESDLPLVSARTRRMSLSVRHLEKRLRLFYV